MVVVHLTEKEKEDLREVFSVFSNEINNHTFVDKIMLYIRKVFITFL